MADELVDQVFAEAPAEAAPPVETPAEAPQPTPADPQEPAPTPEPESPPQPEKVEHQVPLAKYLDTRDELKELKRWKAEQEAKAQAPKVPDPIDDPDGHTAYLRTEMSHALQAQRLEISQEMATEKHGEEAVNAAMEWALQKAQTEPGFGPRYMQERNPIDWIVRQHKRDGLVSQLPSDVSSLDELIEREIAKRGLSATAAPAPAPAAAPQPATKPAAPPKSIASDVSSPATAKDDNADFMDIFRK